jgi:hypothetical protein
VGPSDRHGLGRSVVGSDGELQREESVAGREGSELGVAAEDADEDREVGPARGVVVLMRVPPTVRVRTWRGKAADPTSAV